METTVIIAGIRPAIEAQAKRGNRMNWLDYQIELAMYGGLENKIRAQWPTEIGPSEARSMLIKSRRKALNIPENPRLEPVDKPVERVEK